MANPRLSATTVQNVVTYTVMIDAANPDSKLLPGMTANVAFELAQYQDVLKIPNAALRFTPPDAAGIMAAGPAPAPTPAPKPETPPATDPSAPKPPRGERRKDQQSRVWISSPTGPVSVQIVADASDGSWTRLVKGELTEGQELLTGIVLEGTDSTTNPFAPNMGPRPGAAGQRGGGR